jgi:hypothetical protein
LAAPRLHGASNLARRGGEKEACARGSCNVVNGIKNRIHGRHLTARGRPKSGPPIIHDHVGSQLASWCRVFRDAFLRGADRGQT